MTLRSTFSSGLLGRLTTAFQISCDPELLSFRFVLWISSARAFFLDYVISVSFKTNVGNQVERNKNASVRGENKIKPTVLATQTWSHSAVSKTFGIRRRRKSTEHFMKGVLSLWSRLHKGNTTHLQNRLKSPLSDLTTLSRNAGPICVLSKNNLLSVSNKFMFLLCRLRRQVYLCGHFLQTDV